MATVIRTPYLAVTVNGVAITGVLGARTQLGYSMRTAQAEVEVRALPVGIDAWDTVVITMGATQATAQVRFTGYYTGHEVQLYENTYRLICRGKLEKAAVFLADNSVDMTSRGDGHHDETMVATVLYICGVLPDAITGETVPEAIGGTGRMLGKYSWERGFEWSSGQSGLSFIERLDGVCYGWRTFDTSDGTVVRQLISTAPKGSPDFSFAEGVDIFRASGQNEVLNARNKIVVDGFPGWDGKDEIAHTVTAANPFLIAEGKQFYLTHKVASAMIEKEHATDTVGGDKPLTADEGLDCESVANWLLTELNRRTIRMTLTTPRDDLVQPGQTVAVDASTRMGIDRSFWVQQVDCEVDRANHWSQTLTVFGSDTVSRNGAVIAPTATATAAGIGPVVTGS